MEKKRMTDGMNRRQKAAYIWYYYKWFILLAIGLVILLIVVIVTVHQQQQREYLMNVVMADVDSYAVDESDYYDRFLEEYGYPDETELSLDTTIDVDLVEGGETSVSGYQMLASMFIAGDVDIYTSDESLFDMMCINNGFMDLREVLTESMLEEYADRLWYAETEYADEPVPYGIDLSESAICTEWNFYVADDIPLVGVGSQSNCSQEDLCRMIEYICG